MLSVQILPILEDNYAFIVQSENKVAIVDPGDAKPVIDHLEKNNLTPDIILVTHHHWDHVNGIKEIKEKYGCTVIGPENERHKIEELDKGVSDCDSFYFDTEEIEVIEVAGHTQHHICFYFQQSQILFSGDALFSMGCGRLFEGTADDLFIGFQMLKTLPPETDIYCGHEYTQTNAEFCLTIDPDNQELKARAAEVKKLRAQNKPTIPSTMAQELETNSFLRAETPAELKHIRDLKDNS